MLYSLWILVLLKELISCRTKNAHQYPYASTRKNLHE
jgi:hypothetical protein